MSFELIILGSSSALPTSKRNTAAHLLNMNERFFLIDCGEGVQVQLRKNKLSPVRINHIFISHVHGDHVFGLFGLMSSMSLMGRKAPLCIYGPKEIKNMVTDHLQYFGPLSYELNYIVPEGDRPVYSDKHLEVFSFPLKHRTRTFAYIFKERQKALNVSKEKIKELSLGVEDIRKIKEGEDYQTSEGKQYRNKELTLAPFRRRSYAYVSDTAYCPSIIPHIKGVDLLFHEATFLHKDEGLAKQTFHSTAKQAAEIAKSAEVGQLLLGHFSTRYKDVEDFKKEAEVIFEKVHCVNDHDRFSLPLKRMTE